MNELAHNPQAVSPYPAVAPSQPHYCTKRYHIIALSDIENCIKSINTRKRYKYFHREILEEGGRGLSRLVQRKIF